MNWFKRSSLSPVSLDKVLEGDQVDRRLLRRVARSKAWDQVVCLVKEHRDAEIRRWLGGTIDENLRGRAQAYESLRRDLISFRERKEED
jgi:hypothetical protein